jgi:hypothetical protein
LAFLPEADVNNLPSPGAVSFSGHLGSHDKVPNRSAPIPAFFLSLKRYHLLGIGRIPPHPRLFAPFLYHRFVSDMSGIAQG